MMAELRIMQTGQTGCYDSGGSLVNCSGTGQDAEFSTGSPWPSSRFEIKDEVVRDLLTGLVWTRNGNPGEFPMTWNEALEQVRQWNRESFLGFDDWRMPNRRELRSLMSYQTRKPPLPANHPFTNVFLNWYWTSTTAAIAPAYAWYVHLEGARMFYGKKDLYYLVWPVRGEGNDLLLQTGQQKCYDSEGSEIRSQDSGQDGELQLGRTWPEPRFQVQNDVATDKLTGLHWSIDADIAKKPVNWQEALDTVRKLNETGWQGISTWRLPNINELESLVDCSMHTPALPDNHPFQEVQDGYWSSTTSYFETDWSWVLYLNKGACGVGYKPGKTFSVWPVY